MSQLDGYLEAAREALKEADAIRSLVGERPETLGALSVPAGKLRDNGRAIGFLVKQLTHAGWTDRERVMITALVPLGVVALVAIFHSFVWVFSH